MSDVERKEYKQQFNKEHYESILLQYPKDQQYKARIKALIGDQKGSVNRWILSALDTALAQSEAQQQGYYRDNFEQIIVRYFKTKKLKSRIKPLADADGISVDRWILNTIEEKLQTVESDPASDH